MIFNKIRNSRFVKYVSVLLTFELLLQIASPLQLLALTSGAGAPDFASFEPVATTDMVEAFSGGFTYNLPVVSIPGPDGAGYSLSLSYHSGINQEMEASWVGMGWSLNPGAINRNTSGFPDDYKNDPVIQYNKTKPSWTASAQKYLAFEICSSSEVDPKLVESATSNSDEFPSVNFSLSTGLRYNNYQGFLRSNSMGVGMGFKAVSGGLNFTQSGSEYTVNANVSLGNLVQRYLSKKWKDPEKKDLSNEKGIKKQLKKSWFRIKSKSVGVAKSTLKGLPSASINGSQYNLLNFGSGRFSVADQVAVSRTINRDYSAQINALPLNLGVELGISASFNIRTNMPKQEMSAYGYMYNPGIGTLLDASHKEEYDSKNYFYNAIADYSLEKASTYQKRINFIGIPFNNADNFVVTGEGIGGGFRLYHNQIGHYYPTFSSTKSKIGQLGIELGYGVDISVGLNVGFGSQRMIVDRWSDDDKTNQDQMQYDETENGFFRFTGDLGGKVEYSNNNSAEAIKLDGKHISSDDNILSVQDITSTVGASSSISYVFNSNIENCVDKSRSEYSNYITSEPTFDTRIGEINIINSNGQQFTYGIPVYTRSEVNVQISDDNPTNGTHDVRNVRRYRTKVFAGNKPSLADNATVLGEARDNPYANTFLLTQITGSNYIDAGAAGLDDDDFGSWVKFRYKKQYGFNVNDDTWYHFRTPYTGYNVNTGSIANKEDDLLVMSSGEKEVYYTKFIETKTHIAFFVTNKSDFSTEDQFSDYAVEYLSGSNSVRADARSAHDNNASAGASPSNVGNQPLEYLEKIVLFSKERKDKPMQVTNFEYDYSLIPNTPNSVSSTKGRLTLKKLWFEHEGVVNSMINPYVFKYNYKRSSEYLSEDLRTKYPDIVSYGDAFSGGLENPSYSLDLDPWGNYRPKENVGQLAVNRESLYKSWVDQTPDYAFDPACWNLKQIILPSGGEILIQYEQTDYEYVQDRNALAMVSLDTRSSDTYGRLADDEVKYYLNVADDLGLDETDESQFQELASKIRETYMNNGSGKNEYAYFKFLYALDGYMTGNELNAVENAAAEYIEGFSYVKDVGVEQDGSVYRLYVKLGPSDAFFESLSEKDRKKKLRTLPKRMCYDYAINNYGGLWKNNNLIQKLKTDNQTYIDWVSDLNDDLSNSEMLSVLCENSKEFNGNVYETAKSIMGYLGGFRGEEGGIVGPKYTTPQPEEICKDLQYELSYIRIPLLDAKKGGGIRVKRLLMYDNGLENGDEVLYGSEYIYKTKNGESSGVATNEPSPIKCENPLFDIIPGEKQTFLNRMTTGYSSSDQEGPVGEYILPSASVGHSRVVVKNIHTGNTSTGYAVHEFNTCKDWPYDMKFSNDEISGNSVSYTDLDDNEKFTWLNLPLGIVNFKLNKVFNSQGFRFIIHDMHGKPKRNASFAGDYMQGLNSVPVSYTEYDYYEPGEKVPLISQYTNYDYGSGENSKKLILEMGNPGKEMDVAMDVRSVKDRTCDFKLEFDLDIVPVPTKVGFGFMPTFSFESNQISTHATSKVIRYPVLLKSQKTYVDGIENVSEQLAFDKYSGQVVLTKSFDSYNVEINNSAHNGEVYNLNILGSWVYPELGQKAENINNLNQLGISVGNIVSYGVGANPLETLCKVYDDNEQPVSNAPYLSSIISASAQTMARNLFVDNVAAGIAGINPTLSSSVIQNYGLDNGVIATATVFEELNKRYYPKSSYVYRSGRTNSNGSEEYNYMGGLLENFNLFDWSNEESNVTNNWLLTSQVTKYSPNGQALEERNILNIYSAVKFGYSNRLPVIVATNAKYEELAFNDFETDDYTENLTISDEYAHSGKRSVLYTDNMNISEQYGLVATQNIAQRGMIVRFWLNSMYNNPTFVNTNSDISIAVNSNRNIVDCEKIAKTGDWALYQAVIPSRYFTYNTAINIILNYSLDAGNNETVYVDDIRIQPADAQATCYVYDVATYKLLAQFDDQHFGKYYQYNKEGQLVRQIVETEKGKVTLKENLYNAPKRNRDESIFENL